MSSVGLWWRLQGLDVLPCAGSATVTPGRSHCYSYKRLLFWHTTDWVTPSEAEAFTTPSSSGHQRFSPDATCGIIKRVRNGLRISPYVARLAGRSLCRRRTA